MFTRSTITPPEVNGFGWNLGNSRVYCLELALTDFGHDSCRSESGRPCGSFVFLSGKQRTTLPISGQPNFTKFAHKTWFCEVLNPFGIIFWKFALMGSFFQKNRDHRQRFPTSSRDFSEMITNLGKSWQVGAPMECWLSIRTVGINSKSFLWPVQRARERTFKCPVVWLDFTYLKRSSDDMHSVSNPFLFLFVSFRISSKLSLAKLRLWNPHKIRTSRTFVECVCYKTVYGYHHVRYTYMSIYSW